MPTIGEAKASQNGHSVQRIELPVTGGWWELNTRPPWGKLMGIRKAMAQPDSTDEDNINIVLQELTIKWSFDDEVTADAIEQMDIEDIGEVMEVVNNSILPLFERMVRS